MSKRELAIDLGTANTLVYQRGSGIVYDEPTIAAVDSRSGAVLEVGSAAWEAAAANADQVSVVRPLQGGAITNFEAAAQMVRAVLRRVGVSRLAKPRILVCVPSMLTPVERRAVEEALAAAGARGVSLVDEPLAAAIGAALPIQEAVGNMIVDIGGGTSEMAMVALGGVVASKAIRVGGFNMDEAVRRHLRRGYGVAIGERAAERLKLQLGSAYPAAEATEVEVRGRDVATGLPTAVTVTPEEIREVLSEPVRAIVETTRACLAESPPELAHDVLETGLFLTGGGALLRGLDMRLAQECEVPVHLTEEPLRTVVMGAGKLLQYLPEYQAAFPPARRG